MCHFKCGLRIQEHSLHHPRSKHFFDSLTLLTNYNVFSAGYKLLLSTTINTRTAHHAFSLSKQKTQWEGSQRLVEWDTTSKVCTTYTHATTCISEQAGNWGAHSPMAHDDKDDTRAMRQAPQSLSMHPQQTIQDNELTAANTGMTTSWSLSMFASMVQEPNPICWEWWWLGGCHWPGCRGRPFKFPSVISSLGSISPSVLMRTILTLNLCILSLEIW